MAEVPPEVQKKIQRVLGIAPDALKQYDAAQIIDELCDTAIMLDEDNVLAQLTSLREKLTAINGRIWNLLGKHDPKRARENLSGITELERYVGELKRKIGEAQQAPPPQVQAAGPDPQREELERRLRQIEKRLAEMEADVQNVVHMLMEIEELREETRGVLTKVGSTLSDQAKEEGEGKGS